MGVFHQNGQRAPGLFSGFTMHRRSGVLSSCSRIPLWRSRHACPLHLLARSLLLFQACFMEARCLPSNQYHRQKPQRALAKVVEIKADFSAWPIALLSASIGAHLLDQTRAGWQQGLLNPQKRDKVLLTKFLRSHDWSKSIADLGRAVLKSAFFQGTLQHRCFF